jgi:hypothetical protein
MVAGTGWTRATTIPASAASLRDVVAAQPTFGVAKLVRFEVMTDEQGQSDSSRSSRFLSLMVIESA